MLGKLKGITGKLDKKALGAAVMLMIMSWAALPIVYFLIVRKKGRVKEVKTVDVPEEGSGIVHHTEEVGAEDGREI